MQGWENVMLYKDKPTQKHWNYSVNDWVCKYFLALHKEVQQIDRGINPLSTQMSPMQLYL